MILVTGANGFIGHALASYLSKFFPVRGVTRDSSPTLSDNFEKISGFDLLKNDDWTVLLSGVSVIVHCAARVHVMKDRTKDPLDEYRKVNVDGTLRLAKQAVRCGVKRFIYLSSIKVNGESTNKVRPFTPDDEPSPEDAYALSKWEAECELLLLAKKENIEVVIIRPTLVYGPDVKANFLALMKLVGWRIPIPLGLADKNLRSYLAIDNLLSFIRLCLLHPNAANQIFLVSDGEDLSTKMLLKKIARSAQTPIYLFPFPTLLLKLFMLFVGKKTVSNRLLGNLQVDISKNSQLLQWYPRARMDDVLRKMVSK